MNWWMWMGVAGLIGLVWFLAWLGGAADQVGADDPASGDHDDDGSRA